MIPMEFLLATGIGWTVACGLYLLLRARSFSVVLGLSLLGYAVNVFIFAMGRLWSAAPPIIGAGHGGTGPYADPLPQALVLTAIVIGFATTGFVIELALRGRHTNGTDHVDGVADRASHGPGDALRDADLDGVAVRDAPEAGAPPGAADGHGAGGGRR